MRSLSKKFRKSFDTYEQVIQKQLIDDFKVNQYLNQNQSEGNIEQYLNLFNSLQVNNTQKKKIYDTLQVKYQNMNTDRMNKSLQLSKISNWNGARQSFMVQYQQTQINTSNQIEVKNTLQNQIIQTQKSLNLLKGDIGHLISRNQSANILESKISKVKIVADDQLQRVSVAYSKDKQEYKERKDMQRKFNKKLKNVSMFQSSSLTKLKKNYINTMVQKKYMHDRLAYIEKLSSSIFENKEKYRLKNITNEKTLEMYRHFQKLLKLIQKVPQIQNQYKNFNQLNIKDLVSNISSQFDVQNGQTCQSYFKISGRSRVNENETKQINSQDLQMVNKQSLRQFEQIIKSQYTRLTKSIENKTKQYDFNVKKSQELLNKLNQEKLQISKIQLSWLNQLSSQYVLTPSVKENYLQKLKKFISTIKTFFVLLEFIEKHLNYSTQVCNQRYHEKIMAQTQTFTHKKPIISLQPEFSRSNPHSSKTLIPSNKSLMLTQKSYISNLYKTYNILLNQDSYDSKLEEINQQIFESLKIDVEVWLNQIKTKIIQGKGFIELSQKKNQFHLQKESTQISRELSKIRSSIFSNKKKAKTFIELEEEEINDVKQEYQEYLQNFNQHYTAHHEIMRHNSVGKLFQKNKLFKSTLQFILKKGMQNYSHSQIANKDKLKHCSMSLSPGNLKEAKRIKFLQDLDKDYYKMIKSTMSMEKQNTKKNYDFQKTFNRAKYSSKDEILEQKRFQSSFSTLFSGKNDRKCIQQELPIKKSGFFIRSTSQNRLSKCQQSRNSISSSQAFRNSKISELMNQRSSVETTKRQVTDKSLQHKKHHFSLKMKDIINLV